MTLTRMPFLQFLSSFSFSAWGVLIRTVTLPNTSKLKWYYYISVVVPQNVLLSRLSRHSHTPPAREATQSKKEDSKIYSNTRSDHGLLIQLRILLTLLLITISPFDDRAELCSCGWHMRIDLILFIYIMINTQPWFSIIQKLRYQARKIGSYFPTTLNIFSIFWWEWSSGRFSAITVRSCPQLICVTTYNSIKKKKKCWLMIYIYICVYLQLLFFFLGEGMLAFHLLPIAAHDLHSHEINKQCEDNRSISSLFIIEYWLITSFDEERRACATIWLLTLSDFSFFRVDTKLIGTVEN